MKVAISIPDPVFIAAERLAKELRVSRSQLYAEAVAQYLERRGAAAVTARLDEVYAREPSGLPDPLSRAQAALLADEAW